VRLLSGHNGRVTAAVAAGSLLATGSVDRTLRVWDLQTGSMISTYAHDDWVTAVALPGGGHVVSADRTGRIVIRDLAGGDAVTIQGHRGAVRGLLVAEDGRALLSYGDDQWIALWDWAGGSLASVRLDAPITSLHVIDSRRLAAGTRRGGIVLMSLESAIAAASFRERPSSTPSLEGG
jgi:WD40 repeat protein